MVIGLWLGILSFVMWGLLPLYWVQLSHVPAKVVLGFRIVTALSVAVPYLFKNKATLKKVFSENPLEWINILSSASLIGINWYLFMLCMLSKQILECSLAYFITPLMAVFIGIVLLKEKVNAVQKVSLGLAFIAVATLCVALRIPPYLALFLAVTFGFYGFFKKRSKLKGVLSVSLEVLILSFVGGFFVFQHPLPHYSPGTWVFLSLSGPVTIIPLILYAVSLERVDYTLIGFLQYIAPVMHFVMALYLFKEAFLPVQKFAFFLIWVALVLFTVDLVRTARQKGSLRKTV